jgi:pSer/pThr/pTyr-binding forkhead associated (FHA) protein
MAISVIVHGARPCSDPGGRRITFDAPRIVIGRAASSDVRLPDASVSLRHITIQQRGNRLAVVDEGSTNGTFVGRTKLSPKAPHTVDKSAFVRVGRYVVELTVGHDTPSAQPAAVAKEIALGLVIEQLLEEGEDARPRLTAVKGPDEGATIVLAPGERVTIGRSREATLSLSDAGASRRHVEVVWRGDGVFARDLGSKSGSALGDRVLGATDTPWRNGETLLLGETEIACTFEAPEALAELERAPDERFPTAEIDLRAFEPEPDPEPEAEAEAAGEASDASAEDDAQAEDDEPVPEPPRARGTAWGMTDIAVVLLALGVFSLSAVGYMVLLR